MSERIQNISLNDDATRFTLSQYFEFENSAERRHEFHDGQVIPINAATENHGRIVTNLSYLLQSCLRNSDCDIFTEDRPLFIKKCNKVFYPDVLLVCGEREYFEYSKNIKATLNPTVVIEVLSDSTQSIDRGNKWRCYRKINSLKQYILIEQEFVEIEIYQKDESGNWFSRLYEDLESSVTVNDCTMPIKEIYHKVEMVQPNSASDDPLSI